MKYRVIGFILFVSMLAPVGGTYLWLHHRQACARKEAHLRIRQGRLSGDMIRLTLTAAEEKTALRWIDDHEFEYGGKMYDLVMTSRSGETTTFTCIPDRKEQMFRDALQDLVRRIFGTDAPTRGSQKAVTPVAKSLFCSSLPLWTDWPNEAVKPAFRSMPLYTSLYKQPHVPPPRHF